MRPMKYGRLFAILISVGCADNPVVCTGEEGFAITVHVRDASTGEPAALSATLVVREGAYADSMTGTQIEPSLFSIQLEAARDRPGTYDILVRKAGYQTWFRRRVRVDRSSCGLEGVRFDVNLTPGSSFRVRVGAA
jgi:hypothetical protein